MSDSRANIGAALGIVVWHAFGVLNAARMAPQGLAVLSIPPGRRRDILVDASSDVA